MMVDTCGFNNRSTRREFMIAATSLAFSAILPGCTHTKNTVQDQAQEPQITSVIDRQPGASCSWLQWNRQFETSSFSHMTYGKLTRNRSHHNKQFTQRTWPSEDGLKTPAIEDFEPGNLYNHPAVINSLRRMGGRPRGIHVEEINTQPDASVAAFLRQRINI